MRSVSKCVGCALRFWTALDVNVCPLKVRKRRLLTEATTKRLTFRVERLT